MKSPKDSFITSHPELLGEWDFDRNKRRPEEYTLGSTVRVSWVCQKGHRYESSVFRRAVRGQGCPYCSNSKALAGFNDLESKCPRVAAEWNYQKNGDLTPRDVLVTTNKKVWWKCKKCGHEWNALISNRSRGSGCPNCRYKKSVKTRHENNMRINGSFADNYPELLLDWDYEKNNDIVYPTDISFGSNIRVYWKCHVCGHEWKGSVNNRSHGVKCRKCSYKERQASNRKQK